MGGLKFGGNLDLICVTYSWIKTQKKLQKSTKKVEHGQKLFQIAFGYAQHPKGSQNTQQIKVIKLKII